jgi:L-asparaginase II
VPVPLVRVVRSGLEESVHLGDVAVVDAGGDPVASVGDPRRIVFARSSMKPLQATVSLSVAPFDFSDQEVAVMCASHNAEPIHVQTVRSLLERASVPEVELQCPEVRPWDDESRAADPTRRRINSDCSGKHGGMLAACHAQGWPVDSYREPGHPLQRRVLGTVREASGFDDPVIGVDGCGVPVHGMPLAAMARIFARLATAARWEGDLGPSAARAVAAMRAQPYLVAGRNRVDTAVMDVAPEVAVKGGAEALICAAVVDRGLGMAVKVHDGGSRAVAPAFVRVLHQLGVLGDEQVDGLETFAAPPVLGGGRPVGRLVADFDLVRP